jgi:hypothetical protein
MTDWSSVCADTAMLTRRISWLSVVRFRAVPWLAVCPFSFTWARKRRPVPTPSAEGAVTVQPRQNMIIMPRHRAKNKLSPAAVAVVALVSLLLIIALINAARQSYSTWQQAFQPEQQALQALQAIRQSADQGPHWPSQPCLRLVITLARRRTHCVVYR